MSCKTGKNDLVVCANCGEEKKKEDFGHSLYYARVCLDCQGKHGLCPDCGGKVVIPKENSHLPFACTGYHYVEGESLFPIIPMRGDVKLLSIKAKCPKCGHEFEVK